MLVDPVVHSFNAGELSPLLDGRSDLQKYQSGCQTLQNFIATPYGAAERRPGTGYADVATGGGYTWLLEFRYSIDQAYVIAFSDGAFRIIALDDDGVPGFLVQFVASQWAATRDYTYADYVLNNVGGNWYAYVCIEAHTSAAGDEPGVGANWETYWHKLTFQSGQSFYVEFPSVYAEADLPRVHFKQVNDILYLVHPDRPWQKLMRLGSSSWQMVEVEPEGGPFLDENMDNDETMLAMPTPGTVAAMSDCFEAGHVGARFAIRNFRDSGDLMVGGAGGVGAANAWSDPLLVIGGWEAHMTGTWTTGEIHLERSVDEGQTWEVIHTYRQDTIDSGDEDEHGIYYRMSSSNNFSGSVKWHLASTGNKQTGIIEITGVVDAASFPAWVTATAYVRGDYVVQAGAYYLCLVGHTSGVFATDLAAGYWEEHDTATAWVTATGYVLGDRVHEAGYEYKCIIAHTSGTFSTDLAAGKWRLIGTAKHWLATFTEVEDLYDFAGVTAWATGRSYKVGSLAASGGEAFRCVTAHTAAAAFTTDLAAGLWEPAERTRYWAEGAWSDVRGYPGTIAMLDSRLWLGGSTYEPGALWGSAVDDWENMRLGTLDDSPMKITIAASQQNRIRWMADKAALLVGTQDGESSVHGVNEEPLTSTSVKVDGDGACGGAAVMPIKGPRGIMFVEANAKRLRWMGYQFESDGYESRDLTILAEHITGDGIVAAAYQRRPHPCIWCVRDDGVLLGLTYEPSHDVIAWHRHGLYDIDLNYQAVAAEVESVAVIPGETEDVVVLSVKRSILESGRGSAAVTKRYIEYFRPRKVDSYLDAWHLDSALSWNGGDAVDCTTLAIASGTVTLTLPSLPSDSSGTDLANGDKIRIAGSDYTELNGAWEVSALAGAGPYTLVLKNEDGSAYTSARGDESPHTDDYTVTWVKKTFDGLDHLEGEDVDAYGDGADVSPASDYVQSGEVTLSAYVNQVVIGLGYTSVLQPMRIDVGTQTGTGQGKIRRIYELAVSFYETLVPKVGTDLDDLESVDFSDEGVHSATVPFTGIFVQAVDDDFNRTGNLYVVQDAPLPTTVRSILPRMEIADE